MMFFLACLLELTSLAPAPRAVAVTVLATSSTVRPVEKTVDAPVIARARALFDRIRANTVDRALLTPQFSAELTPEIIAKLGFGLQGFGDPISFTLRAKAAVDGLTTYDYAVSFASGAITVTAGIDDASGLIAKFYVRRATT